MSDVYNVDKIITYQIKRLDATSLLPFEDAFQIGYLAYLKAKSQWDPKVHEKLTLNYVTTYIYGALLTELRKKLKTRDTESVEIVDNIYSNEDGAWYTNGNPTKDKRIKRLRRLLNKLPKLHKTILEDLYFNEKTLTLREIGEKYNISKQRVYVIKANAIEKLKTALRRDF